MRVSYFTHSFSFSANPYFIHLNFTFIYILLYYLQSCKPCHPHNIQTNTIIPSAVNTHNEQRKPYIFPIISFQERARNKISLQIYRSSLRDRTERSERARAGKKAKSRARYIRIDLYIETIHITGQISEGQ